MKMQSGGWWRLAIGVTLVVLGMTLAGVTSAQMAGAGYGPGAMMRAGNAGTTAGGTTAGAIYGPGMMGGYGYGMGPGMMGGYGYGMGPGMMGGYGYGMGPGMMGGYGMGPGMMGGYGYGMGPGMMGGYGWPGVLNLTRQQEEKVGQIVESSAERQLKHAEALHLHWFDLNQALSKPDPDMNAVKKAYDALAAERKAMFLERVQMQIQLRQVLTKEQMETLQRYRPWMWNSDQNGD